jgi:hypothetical protein
VHSKIHAIFVTSGSSSFPVHLDCAYKVEIENNVIRIARDQQDGQVEAPGRIASIRTLYGINGAGKTQMLMDIAEALASRANGQGMLYSQDGRLRIVLGRRLKDALIDTMLDIEQADDLPAAHAVFYTTSPYESPRRAKLARMRNVSDVTPNFSGDNKFDGLGFLEARSMLEEEFVENAEIEVRSTLLTVTQIAATIAANMKKGQFPKADTQELKRELTGILRQAPSTEVFHFRCMATAANAARDREESQGWARDLSEYVVREYPRRRDVALGMTEMFHILGRYCPPEFRRYEAEIYSTLADWFNRGSLRRQRYSPDELHRYLDERRSLRRTVQYCMDLNLINFGINNLSSGQAALVILFSALHGALQRHGNNRRNDDKPLFLLIDEGEMFMHPQWQRRYVNLLLRFVERLPGAAERAYLVISTHSLIVASDSPPYSLLDVAEGRIVNGFGLGPKGTLDRVYDVDNFAGEYSAGELQKIENAFKAPTLDGLMSVRKIVDSLADEKVKDYLGRNITRQLETMAKK